MLPVVDEADVSSRGGGRRSQVPNEAEDLRGESRELAVLDEVAQVEQRHLLQKNDTIRRREGGGKEAGVVLV